MSLTVAHIGWIASCHLKRRVDALAARGVRGVVFTDHVPEHFRPAAHDFALEVLPRELRRRPLELVGWLEDRLAAHGADLLHAHSTHFPAALAYFVRSVPVINSIWDFVHSRDPFSPLHHRAILGELAAGRFADAVSFSSRSLMDDWIADGYPAERAYWQSWGVNLKVFVPGRHAAEAARLRQRLGIGEDELMVLSPRTPSLPANNDIAMRAVARLRSKHPVRLVITGHHIPREFRYVERLTRRQDVQDGVIFLDTIRNDRDIATLYEASDLVLSLHNNDFNPATVLESFAMRRTVVVNHLKTVNWWAIDGENAFSVPARDLDATVDAMDRALSLPRQERLLMGAMGRARVTTWGDFHKTMDAVPGHYRHLLAQGPRRAERLSPYDRAMLFDICGQHEEALLHYRRAARPQAVAQPEPGAGPQAAAQDESRTLSLDLLREKQAMTSADRGLEYFCNERSQSAVAAMCYAPRHLWKDMAAKLPSAPMSLFRHDFCAGLLPLLQTRDHGRLLEIVRLLAARYDTDLPEWLGETLSLFGRRFGLWRECADLLLALDDFGPALAVFCVEAARALGPDHDDYAPLLHRALDWTVDGLAHINSGLDREFRLDVREQARELLGRVPDTAAAVAN